jgi:hypothetical protein
MNPTREKPGVMRDKELAALIVAMPPRQKGVESNKSPLPGYRKRPLKNQ